MAISFLQELDALMDGSSTATNRTKQFTSNITTGSLLLAAFSVYAADPALITIEDDKSNTWVLIGRAFESGTGRGCAAYYARANVASEGSMPLVTFNKNTAVCVLGGSILEVAGVHADVLDVTTVTANGVSVGPCQVTLGTTLFTDDCVMAVLGMPGTSWATATPLTDYTDSVSNTVTGAMQHKIQKRIVSSVAAYTPGWTISQNSQWAVVGFVLKGSTTNPTITSISSTTPRKNSTLTITGVNFGGSTGTVTLGGTSLTVTSWSDTSIQATVSEGTNKFGVAASLSITTSGAVVSNTWSTITAILPLSGWNYINLSTPEIFTAHRITAVGDLASGDQIVYDTVTSKVLIYVNGTFSCDQSVTSFAVKVWNEDGWGSSGTQTVDAGDYVPPDDTIVIGGHKNSATMELPGVYLATVTRLVWSNILDDEKGAPINLPAVTSLSITVTGTFGPAGYIVMEGSADGVTYATMVDEASDPLIFDAAGTKTSIDVMTYMRPKNVDGDGTTDLKVVMLAS